MTLDTPKTPRNIKWIWWLVLPLFILNTSLAEASNIKEIDKYKIYIHLKVVSNTEYLCITKLWTLENRLWDPYAKNKNSSAFGIPQLLKMKETNPYLQMDLGYKYLLHRYSNRGKDVANAACNALAFHNKRGYY
jgi:hypothetical protein